MIFWGVNFKLTLFCIKKIYKYNSQKYTAVKFFGINISGEISKEGILEWDQHLRDIPCWRGQENFGKRHAGKLGHGL